MNEAKRRSWDSVCGDCERYRTGRCAATRASTDPKDSIAAICEWYLPAREPPRDAKRGEREENIPED